MRNPYIVSRPLDENDLFTGRETEFKELDALLHNGERVILIFGAPRAGKTSFLKQLERMGLASDEIHMTQLPTAPNLMTSFLLCVHSALGGELPGVCESLTDAKEYIRHATESVDSKTLICIDGIELETIQDPQTLEDLVWALGAAGNVRMLITMRGLPSQLEWDAKRIAHIVIPPFSEQETADALMVPVRGRLAYDIDVVHQIHRFSGGTPYYVQLFGRLIFEKRAAKGWVGKAEAEETLPAVLKRAEDELAALWNQCTGTQRIVLCALAEMKGCHGVASPDDVVVYVRRHQYHIELKAVQIAYTQLLNAGLLQELGGSTARFESELFRRWLQIHVQCQDVLAKSSLQHLSKPKYASFNRSQVDWVGVLLWIVAIALVFAVTWIWRSRETNISVGSPLEPGEQTPATSVRQTPVLPAMVNGIVQGRIAYQARQDEGDDWDIWVMQADGSDPVQLTKDPGQDTWPQFSPDGQKLLFVSDRDGNREVYVMNADGNAQRNLTRSAGDDWDPSWSPDGQYITFSSFRDDNWNIYICKADGSDVTRLTTMTSAERAPTWSPDGERIAFMSDAMGNWDIYTMTTSGDDLVQLTVHEATDQFPQWSPDGKHILWGTYRQGDMEIYVALADGNAKESVSQSETADDQAGAWSPWGTHIAYDSNIAGGWDILTVDRETGQRTNITSSPEEEQRPTWGP